MPRFNIPVVLEALDLGEYHESLKDQFLQVWVNPDKPAWAERDAALLKWAQVADVDNKRTPEETQAIFDKVEAAMNTWFMKIWSQGPEETRPSKDDLAAYDEHPAFMAFLKRRTMEMINAHQDGQKKTSTPQ